ncbi:MAG: hypothetical protein NXH97_12515 [Rhodobacteraceae bacterium]|nr:hypothetical protein [Paracoccaceae bacterium]
MTAKLHINLTQGIIDVEGDAELVKSVYDDFKDRLSAQSTRPTTHENPTDQDGTEANKPAKPKPRARARKPAKSSGEDGPKISADAPQLDKNLDTSGLANFFGQFEPSNNAEKILIFLKFLVDELGIEQPNTDQVFTCYEAANERVPKVFSQAFRDASGKKFGYIQYNSSTDVQVTTIGNNHFKFDLKKKSAE